MIQTSDIYRAADFQCGRCGRCCHFKKGVNVALTITDILRISERLGLSVQRFVSRYCTIESVPVYLPAGQTEETAVSRLEELGIRLYSYLPSQSGHKSSGYNRYLALNTEGRTCAFYDDGCVIHDVKPTICELYPFTGNFTHPLTEADRDCQLKGISHGQILVPGDQQYEKNASLFLQDLMVGEYFKRHASFDEAEFLSLWRSIPEDILHSDAVVVVASQKQLFARQMVMEGVLKGTTDARKLWYR